MKIIIVITLLLNYYQIANESIGTGLILLLSILSFKRTIKNEGI